MTVGLRSSISIAMGKDVADGGAIRKMFEAGAQLRAQGIRVFDFSLGSPQTLIPQAVADIMCKYIRADIPHGYMPNVGYPQVREVLAERITRQQGLSVPLTGNHIVVTPGAASALNILGASVYSRGSVVQIIKDALFHRGGELVVPAPFFAEYSFYFKTFGVKIVGTDCDDTYHPILDRFESSITRNTRAVLINPQNNPTGAVYSKELLMAMNQILQRKEREYGHYIYAIIDEPYSGIVCDKRERTKTLAIFDHGILVYSYSKSLSLAGERIGYLAINPMMGEQESARLFAAFAQGIRALGFVCASALSQRTIGDPDLPDIVQGVDMYEERRNALVAGFKDIGFDAYTPEGTFYYLLKVPGGDDVKFAAAALKKGLLIVPGSAGFRANGRVRLSTTMNDVPIIWESMNQFKELKTEFMGGAWV